MSSGTDPTPASWCGTGPSTSASARSWSRDPHRLFPGPRSQRALFARGLTAVLCFCSQARILPPLSTQTIPSFPLCFRSPLFQVQTAFHVRDHRYRTETANEHALQQQHAVFLNQGEEESHFPKRSMTSVLQPSHRRQTLPRQWPHPETWPILPHL